MKRVNMKDYQWFLKQYVKKGDKFERRRHVKILSDLNAFARKKHSGMGILTVTPAVIREFYDTQSKSNAAKYRLLAAVTALWSYLGRTDQVPRPKGLELKCKEKAELAHNRRVESLKALGDKIVPPPMPVVETAQVEQEDIASNALIKSLIKRIDRMDRRVKAQNVLLEQMVERISELERKQDVTGNYILDNLVDRQMLEKHMSNML